MLLVVAESQSHVRTGTSLIAAHTCQIASLDDEHVNLPSSEYGHGADAHPSVHRPLGIRLLGHGTEHLDR